MHPMRILHCARTSKYSPFRGLIVWMRVGTGIEQGPTKDGTLLRTIDPKVSIGDIAGFKLCPYEDPRTFRADVRNARMTLWQNVNLDDRVVRVLRFSRRALCPCASRGSALSLHFSLSLRLCSEIYPAASRLGQPSRCRATKTAEPRSGDLARRPRFGVACRVPCPTARFL